MRDENDLDDDALEEDEEDLAEIARACLSLAPAVQRFVEWDSLAESLLVELVDTRAQLDAREEQLRESEEARGRLLAIEESRENPKVRNFEENAAVMRAQELLARIRVLLDDPQVRANDGESIVAGVQRAMDRLRAAEIVITTGTPHP